MRSGDLRWLSAMEELAAHVADIDIYHTDGDKSAYQPRTVLAHRPLRRCRALDPPDLPACSWRRWRRAVERAQLLDRAAAALPADRRRRSAKASIELVNWVVDMDEGRRTVFRFLSRGDTGLASSTVSPDYHGPGRGAGNSIVTLFERVPADARIGGFSRRPSR